MKHISTASSHKRQSICTNPFVASTSVDSLLRRPLRILRNPLHRIFSLLQVRLRHLPSRHVLLGPLPQQYPRHLSHTHTPQEEINSSQSRSQISPISITRTTLHPRVQRSYSKFRGLIIKHHLVQIAPVAVSAMFCVRLKLSAGLVKSLTPARTSVH